MTPLRLAIETLGILSACYLAYLWLVRRFADWAQPFRLELACLGETVLAKETAAPKREQTQFCLDNAFNGWIAPVMLALLPVAALLALIHTVAKQPKPVEDADDRRLAWLFCLSIFSANPLFGTALALEFVVVTVVLVALCAGQFAFTEALLLMIRAERAVPALGRRSAASC